MREVKVYQVDAFAARAFEGNPAAVCLLPRGGGERLGDATLQRIAAEMNLSETAFVEPRDSGDFAAAQRFALRWFTPSREVPLCGHATLATAAALLHEECNPAQALFFETLSGELSVSRSAQAGRLCMDLPLVEATAAAVPPGTGLGSKLLEALLGEAAGLEAKEVRYAGRLQYLLVVLRGDGDTTRRGLEGLRPDLRALEALHNEGRITGVIVTAQGDGTHHAVLSRFFAPWAGIDEDPVTGSAHSVLGPYWGQRLGVAELACRQCSARGGELSVAVDWEAGRVRVAGASVTVLRGTLLLPEPQ